MDQINHSIKAHALRVVRAARHKNLRLLTVESCTGGLVVAALTAIAGASDVVEGGFVTYANRAKVDAVSVPEVLLARYGAVSVEVATAMAEGGLRRSQADLVISTTGIAGPGGATPEKPIGLVHFAIASRTQSTLTRVEHFDEPDRTHVRKAAVFFALNFLLDCIG